MEQRGKKRLMEPREAREAGIVTTRQSDHRGEGRRGPPPDRETHENDRQHLPEDEYEGERDDQACRPESFPSIFRKTIPQRAAATVHPASGDLGRVEQVRLQLRRTECAGQFDPVM